MTPDPNVIPLTRPGDAAARHAIERLTQRLSAAHAAHWRDVQELRARAAGLVSDVRALQTALDAARAADRGPGTAQALIWMLIGAASAAVILVPFLRLA